MKLVVWMIPLLMFSSSLRAADSAICEGGGVELPEVENKKEMNDFNSEVTGTLNASELESFCKDLMSYRQDKYTTSELISRLDKLFEVNPSSTNYSSDFQKAWSAQKHNLKCKTTFVDWNTGDEIKVALFSYALMERNMKFLWQLLKDFDLDLNVWNPNVTDPTKNETPLDYVDTIIKESKDNVKQQYIELRDALISKFSAKRCKDIPECSNG
jgi:hypothetical protein